MTKIHAAITAVGGYVPSDVLSNSQLEKLVDTNDAWIQSRTGIKERRILKDPNKASAFMGSEAAKQVLEKRGIDSSEIDLIICGTVTPDMTFPATACLIADAIGAVNAFAYDISAACSGFTFCLATGAKFIESGMHKKVLVIGVDKMSSIINYEDRATCIIFGDGGGAVLLEPNTEGNGIIDYVMGTDGSGAKFLHQKAGGSLRPPTHETIDAKMHYVFQDGQTVFKTAVTKMAEVAEEVLLRNKLTGDDITWLVPHQANKRIIDATASRVNLPDYKVMTNIEKYGNTTNGTIPLLLWEYEKKLKKGDNLLIAAFGGGFSWGSILVKWAY